MPKKRQQTPEERAEWEQKQLCMLHDVLEDFARDIEEYETLSEDLPCEKAKEQISIAIASLQEACRYIKEYQPPNSRKK